MSEALTTGATTRSTRAWGFTVQAGAGQHIYGYVSSNLPGSSRVSEGSGSALILPATLP